MLSSEKRWKSIAISMFKDEEPYLDEWLCHHLGLGIGHFVLFDNGSTDNSRGALRKYINRGIVTLIDWPMPGAQVEAFNYAAQIYRHASDWLTFLDTDEFLVLKHHTDITSFLSDFDEATDQVLIPWLNFGYSGHITRSPTLTIDTYFFSSIQERVQTKHFVRSERLLRAGVHSSKTSNNNACLEDKTPTKPGILVLNASYENAQINHYATRSKAEFDQRVLKGEASGQPNKNPMPFPAVSPKENPRWRLDNSILRHRARTLEILNRFKLLPEVPHRFGFYSDNNSFAYPGPTLIHQIAAVSIGNHLLGEQTPQAASKFDFNVWSRTVGFINLGPDVSGITGNLVEFRAPGLRSATQFLGSVHFADMVRRLSAQLISVSIFSEAEISVLSTINRYNSSLILIFSEAEEGNAIRVEIEGEEITAEQHEGTGQVTMTYTYMFKDHDSTIRISSKDQWRHAEVLVFSLP